MSEGEKATSGSGSGDVEASELRGSGLVNHLKSRWEAAYAGDRAALLASGEELPPLSQLPAAARAFGGPGAGPAARGMAAARTPGASPQLLEAVLREDDPEERVEAWEVQERRPGGGLLAEGGDAEAAQDPRRTSLVQYVRATLKNRGEMRLVFKTPKPSPEVAKVLDIEAMTAKEIGMYQHVLPNMASLWPEQAFDVFPRCIHSSDDALILEDLREAGFAEAEHPEAGLDVEQCAAVLAALARFHAASLAYKCAGVAEAGEVLAQAGHETVYTAQRREKIEPLLAAAARNTLELLKRHPQASKHAAKVKALLSDRFGRLAELHRAREPWAVLTHGDPRARNAVFRARAAPDAPSASASAAGAAPDAAAPRLEVRLLDLRACRYGSPALDLVRLLYGGVAAPAARAEQDALLRGYYQVLSRALKTAPGAPQPPFSLAQLRKEVEDFAVYGLLTADLSLRLQLNAATVRVPAEEGEEGEGGDGDGGAAAAAAVAEEFITSNAPGDAFARAFGDLVLELADRGLLK